MPSNVTGLTAGTTWTPEQIAGVLKEAYPEDPAMRISHETIYRSLFSSNNECCGVALDASETC